MRDTNGSRRPAGSYVNVSRVSTSSFFPPRSEIDVVPSLAPRGLLVTVSGLLAATCAAWAEAAWPLVADDAAAGATAGAALGRSGSRRARVASATRVGIDGARAGLGAGPSVFCIASMCALVAATTRRAAFFAAVPGICCAPNDAAARHTPAATSGTRINLLMFMISPPSVREADRPHLRRDCALRTFAAESALQSLPHPDPCGMLWRWRSSRAPVGH